MLISAFTNALIKSQYMFNIGRCTVNKQWTTVFLLTNINKDEYI